MLYISLQNALGQHFTYPTGSKNLEKNRLVDMYTRACRPEFKESLLDLFVQPGNHLRVVIATTAFGMGIDCPDINRIIHWGTPSSLEQYAQETGRAGRDGKQAYAILYYKIKERHIEEPVHVYCRTVTECRKQLLFKSFLFYNDDFSSSDNNVKDCKCCDVCAIICTCALCKFI